MKTPLLILIFNRPKETRQLLIYLQKIKPKKIYVFSDGPRNNNLSDIINNNNCKSLFKKLKWKCSIKKKYLKNNLGCKNAVSKGISWFFKNEKYGIILEDDCMPTLGFFNFCEWGLKKFKDNKNIGSITGNNFLKSKVPIKSSYYFSKYAHCWGWATWSDRWKIYDKNISFWKKWKHSKNFEKMFNLKLEYQYWKKIFDNVFLDKIDSWAYPWNLCLWYNNKVTLTPKCNLVKNIGYGGSATHTFVNSDNLKYQTSNLVYPYKSPQKNNINIKADNYVFFNHIKGLNYLWPYRFFYILNLVLNNPRFVIFKIKKYIG